MFKKDMIDTSTTYTVSDYIAKTDPKKDTITVEPVSHHITCETTGKILGYRYLVKRDPPVWTNYMCNELGRLSHVWKSHYGTDTIESIFHKYKPKDRRGTYVKDLYNIPPQKTETHITRLTAGSNLVDYLGEVSTPTSDLNTMKLHIKSVISNIK